ncbi:MAG: hypothetical protein V9G19_14900, partial [Tetrasphaera sp.]
MPSLLYRGPPPGDCPPAPGTDSTSTPGNGSGADSSGCWNPGSGAAQDLPRERAGGRDRARATTVP